LIDLFRGKLFAVDRDPAKYIYWGFSRGYLIRILLFKAQIFDIRNRESFLWKV
jgi:hypothetical protein